jgi:hypothetical protein
VDRGADVGVDMGVEVVADDPSLAALIRTVASEHPDEASPHALAADVLARVRAGTERDVLARLLPRYVGDVLRRAEQKAAGDAGDAWAKILDDRVPTERGYQFLRDCTAEEVQAGAARRRASAENFTKRAELYEEVAALLADIDRPDRTDQLAGVAEEAKRPEPTTPVSEPVQPTPVQPPPARPAVPTVADIPVEVGAEIVRHARGYVAPTGVSLADVPRAFKPTVNEILPELEALPADVLIAQFNRDPDLLGKVVLGEARGWLSDHVASVLADPAVADARLRAITTVRGNLTGALSRHRAEGHLKPKQRHVMVDDLERVKELAVTARRDAMRGPGGRPRPWPPEVFAVLKELRAEHDEEFHTELKRRFDEIGLAPDVEVSTPPADELWPRALELGLVEQSPEAVELLGYTDAAFRDVVADDVNGPHDPRLRDEGVLGRWRATLRELNAEQEGAGAASSDVHDARRARRVRFHAELMARLTEVNALHKASRIHLRELVWVANRMDERKAVVNATNAWLLQKYAPDLLPREDAAQSDA